MFNQSNIACQPCLKACRRPSNLFEHPADRVPRSVSEAGRTTNIILFNGEANTLQAQSRPAKQRRGWQQTRLLAAVILESEFNVPELNMAALQNLEIIIYRELPKIRALCNKR